MNPVYCYSITKVSTAYYSITIFFSRPY